MARVDAMHSDFKKGTGEAKIGLVAVKKEKDKGNNANKAPKESCNDLKLSTDNIRMKINDMVNRIFN